ncbi:MAG TPA: HAMP domain-containing sensor histidine kinase [Polyangiaceae bacterium]|nr:HAMP domain-containing sensor histidine kinase [Polyangiaceae bacterium]
MRDVRDKADAALRGADAEVARGVAAERASEDATLSHERAVADRKLDDERAERRRALAALLRHEREGTDQHLLTERARADDAIASRDDFLGMVSHDLRTLLGGVAMSAALLLGLPPDGEEGKQMRLEAERIRRLTARMNRLIGDLLDVTSIESGRLHVVPERHDAARLLNDTIEAFQPLASAKGVAMSAEVASGSVLASFDHERILQVLANLVGNAVKFTEAGGHIALRVEPLGPEVRFSVSDTGPGISTDLIDVIFERFWQVGRADRRGLGLGLYISRCIVEAHGGKIWAESEAGRGSTFHFTLPGGPGPASTPKSLA